MSGYYIRQRSTVNNRPVCNRFFGALFALLMAFAGSARAQYISPADTILAAPGGDTFVLEKADYHIIATRYPELMYADYPAHPRLLYAARNGGDGLLFESEAGYDYYCEVYAFFLKQRNGAGQHALVRDTLNRLFHNLNSLFAGLNCGGNYYAHMERRMAGYIEYSVYLNALDNAGNKGKYPVAAQKSHYIALLRQIVADEMMIDNDMVDCSAGRKQDLKKLIDGIDRLITTKFYLEQALAFQTGLSAGEL